MARRPWSQADCRPRTLQASAGGCILEFVRRTNRGATDGVPRQMSDSDTAKHKPSQSDARAAAEKVAGGGAAPVAGKRRKREIGGVDGPEPTRYGDWERNGRCTDF